MPLKDQVENYARKFIEKRTQRLALTLAFLSQAIEGIEGASLSGLQNDFRTRHPVGMFAVNQMSDDVEHTPGISTFAAERPRVRQVA